MSCIQQYPAAQGEPRGEAFERITGRPNARSAAGPIRRASARHGHIAAVPGEQRPLGRWSFAGFGLVRLREQPWRSHGPESIPDPIALLDHWPAFEHKCPEAQIKVIREDADIWAYELDVCGERRLYRDIGAEGFYFVDVTEKPAEGPKP
jgi:hypothetical protein